MSILNAFVTPDLALLGFDTEGTLPDGSRVEACKALFLPHLNAAVGFRGAADLFAIAAPSLIAYTGSFDRLSGFVPEVIRGSLAVLRSNPAALYPDEPFNFVLVGFSPSLGRMTLVVFEPDPATGDIRETRDAPQAIGPGFGAEAIASLGIRADRDGMRALALDQCRRVRETDQRWPAGGRLFFAEIRVGSTVIEEILQFPPREVAE